MTNREKDKQYIWHPFTPQEGALSETIFITKAEGVYLHTSDGRKIIDAISSWWVNLHGHSHPAIAEAIAAQAAMLEHVMFAGFTHQPAIDLAENLLRVLPTDFSKIFFSDNGSTANEVAIKMAIQYWYNKGVQKKKIIAIDGAYHGDTFGAMAVGERSVFTAPFASYLFDVSFIDFPTPENEEHVFRQFQQILDTNEVGAFVFEPLVQGASGMRMYSAAFLDRLIALAKTKEVICIADEVFTGFYRTGKFFATDYLINKPDIVCLSKGLTGGALPMGVTASTQKIHQAFLSSDVEKSFLHGHSFTGNPLACAAANASFMLTTHRECAKKIEEIYTQHNIFSTTINKHKKVKEVRVLGTILAVEINSEHSKKYTDPLRTVILDYFIKRNILLRPLGNVLYVVPPYSISITELNLIYKNIREFLDQL